MAPDQSYTLSIYHGSRDGQVVPTQVTRSLRPSEAVVRITHAALCGSDLIALGTAGQALGHEGAGYVEAIGDEVRNVRVGDRVGLTGVQRTCGDCEQCSSNWDQYCPETTFYIKPGGQNGCFGERVIWAARELIPIPDALPADTAAGLMCGGATAWTVLTRYGMERGQRVGVLGAGGVGHLAILLGARMGYEMVVISGSPSKRGECLALGAREFYTLDEASGMEPLHHLLLCGPADFGPIIELMAVHGTIYLIAISHAESTIPTLRMIDKGLRLQGSFIASRQDTIELLQFCAEHGISPSLGPYYPLNEAGLREGFKQQRERGIKYKAVFVAQS